MRIMLSNEWWTEHFVEVISLIVSITGFAVAGIYLVKINSQKIKMDNSLNSPVVQLNGSNNNVNIGSLQKGLNEETVVTEQTVIEKDEITTKKELITKLENFLDESKPASILAQIALRLANEFKMPEDIEWLSNEVKGFKDNFGKYDNKGLKLQKAKDSDRHRSIVAELNLQFKNGKTESLSIPMFISQSLYDIENWINQISASPQSIFVLTAPPPQLMVEDLKVDPNERVPYVISKDSINKILNGVRLKIIDFLERAKKII